MTTLALRDRRFRAWAVTSRATARAQPHTWRQFGASGSGCSAYEAKPAWQHDRHCPGRTVADVSAVAATIPLGYAYVRRSFLFDVTTGTNSFLESPQADCGSVYLCVAKSGYDAPTGLGTPDGPGAF